MLVQIDKLSVLSDLRFNLVCCEDYRDMRSLHENWMIKLLKDATNTSEGSQDVGLCMLIMLRANFQPSLSAVTPVITIPDY